MPNPKFSGGKKEQTQEDERPAVIGRTIRTERRKSNVGTATGLERRRSAGRRLSDFSKSAEDGEMNQEQFLFLMAIEGFKKANGKMYPNWTDVLEVIRLLGYRKTMASELKLRSGEDWREAADAPSNVRTERQKLRDRQARGEAA